MRNLPEVTGLRGVAAAIVVAFHALVLYTLGGPGFPGGLIGTLSSYGWIGVDLFFVLSGFLLSLPLLGRPTTLREPGYWRTYLAKRWLRIAPPYYASILVVLLIFNRLSYVSGGTEDVVLHALYLHSFKPDYLFSIDPVYWTLAIEFQFYLLLPLLAFLLARRSWLWTTAGLFAVSLGWRFATYDASDAGHTTWISSQLPGFIGHFALGVAAARVYLADRKLPVRASYAAGAALVAFVALPLAFLLHINDPFPTPSSEQSRLSVVLLRPLLALGFATAILLTRDSALLRGLLSWGPAQRAGTVSYSVYLLHFPLNLWLVQVFPATMSFGFLPYLALSFLVVFAGCTAFYGLVERPCMRIKSRLLDRARAPVPVASLPVRPSAAAGRPSPVAASAVILEAF